jgi:O-antigen/teichoic acid export membrane protein
VLIEIFSGKEAVGFYTAAYALAQTSIATIGAGIDSATYSRAVRAMDSGDTAALQGQLARNCTLLLALMLPASVGLALIAPSLAALCVAPDYVAPVTELISWMAVAALLLGFRANYVDHAFHFGNSTSRLITVMAVIAIVNLGGDVVFIRLYGAVGAAMASIAAGVAGIICGLWMSRNILKLPFPMRDISRILAATGAMAACLWPFRDNMGVATLLCQIIGGVVVFGVAAVALDLLGVREALFSRIRAALG